MSQPTFLPVEEPSTLSTALAYALVAAIAIAAYLSSKD